MRKDIQPKNELNMHEKFKDAVPFFTKNKDGKISISNSNLIKFWESLGYRKVVDENGDYKLVIVKRNSIVKEIKEHQLRDEIRQYTTFKNEEALWIQYLDKEYVVKKLFESFHSLDMNRNSGDERTGYLFYENTIVEVTQDKLELVEYENFQGYVWELEILKREFYIRDNKECVFWEFIQIIADHKEERIKSIVSIIGYLIHSYKDPSCAKAIILMDSEIDVESDEANGRTGKSLIGKAIGYVIPSLFIDGKTMKSQDKFRLSGLNSQHRLIFFDDVKKDFDFESLYPLITGDLHIEKKYKNAVVIPNKESPKILITSNYIVKGGGGNAEKRRKVEFEVSSYFKNELSPLEEFDHRLFDDWDKDEWVQFDNFMIKAVQFYLKNGLIEPMSINIDYNRLKTETSVDFIEFMDALISEKSQLEGELTSEIIVFDKVELFKEFIKTNPSFSEGVAIKTLKKWIDKYCAFYQIKSSHYKSNGKVLVKLNISERIRSDEVHDKGDKNSA
ncbi:primase-helicase family protein [Flavobacterium sp. 83]|uniref:primase-helicase family protein n=1 Tax=Flavobacterium sp. 83 TaxID=1131812 RepID=UPI00054E0A4E|nr:primase-helicase family protein [Flavobacterium sp. 83]